MSLFRGWLPVYFKVYSHIAMQQPNDNRSLDGMLGRRPQGQDTTQADNQDPRAAPSTTNPSQTSPMPAVSGDASIASDMPEDLSAGIDYSEHKKESSRKRRFLNWRNAAIGGSVLLLVLAVAGGLLFWYLQKSVVVDNFGDGAASLQEEVSPEMLQGEGDGRINALLIGVDGKGIGLADTIMLASFDPIAKDVVMISIPRDLYVDMGRFGSAKINAAHVYGEEQGYEGGGPALLKDTVSDVLDVPIHYYARVNFKGFKQAIDTIGGVTVDVKEPLNDPYFPDNQSNGYQPLRVEEGRQKMDGETALRYARSRKTTSDFDRSRRQQQILLSLRDEVLSTRTFTSPRRLTQLLNNLGDNAQTDMSVKEMMRLLELSEGVDEDSVTQAQLSTAEDNFLTFSNVYGQSVLVPSAGDFSEIQEYVRTLMVDSYIKDEAAKISILNGTEVPGLANDTADLLRSFGYDVVNVDNASEQNYTQTVIFNYNSDNPYTLRYLEQRFGVHAQRREPPGNAVERKYDIEVVLGNDYGASAE